MRFSFTLSSQEADPMMWRRALWTMSLFAAMTTSLACGADAPPASPTCPSNNTECKELATVESGAEAVKKRKCVNCHGDDMAGATTPLAGYPKTPQGDDVELYPPNLTADKATGVGDWTDDALAFAIRSGIDDESQHLCPQMVHFEGMSDFEVYSIIMYLRSIPTVNKKVPRSVCPPIKTKEQQSLGR
jgi:hypothetical protein